MWLWNNKVSLLRTWAALGAPWRRELPSTRRTQAAFPVGQAAGLGMGRAKMKWNEMKAQGKQRAPEWTSTWGGDRCTGHAPTSDADGYVQIEQEKHFHRGNAAVGQRNSVVLPTGRMCYSSSHSTSAEHREKVWSMRSWVLLVPGTTTRSLPAKIAPSPWRKQPGKSREIHTIAQHFRVICPRESNAARERRGDLRASIPPIKSVSQDRLFCCCSQQEDTITCLRPNIWPWATGSERKHHWNSETL